MTATREPLAERLDKWSIRHPHAPVMRRLLGGPVFFWRLGLGRLVARLEIRHGHLVLLTVTGRSSGQPRHTPVTAHVLGSGTYLWCPYGDRAQWYRNLLANPVATVQSTAGPQVVRAVRIEDDAQAVELISELRRFDVTFLRSYLDTEGIADTPEDIATNRERLHLLRLEPAEEDGPPPLEADLVWLWLLPVAAVALRAARRFRGLGSRRG
ncbi:MAG TPA: nitroreductase family deazaflavin-dependent oxidoreductase [Jatrophihabitans sp.]|nr:nitroreductase family deazaflavin-dependent oxidoreductase [Jatrophihabitans sp.]